MKILTFVLIALTVLLGACGNPAPELTGLTWKLVSYGPADEALAAIPDVQTSLVFSDDGQVRGTIGCNQFGGTYKANGDKISFSQMNSTLMACEPGLMNQESAVLAILSSATTYSLSGGRLTITAADGSLATFGQ